MELVRNYVSSRVGASLVNALLQDLKPYEVFSVQNLLVDKAKIDREKARVMDKVKSLPSIQAEILVCIGVDGKIDKDTLCFKELSDKGGNMKLRQESREEHHLTFTNESGTNKGTYLTHRVIPIRGATGQRMAQEVESVLQEYSSSHSLKAILVDNTSVNTGGEAGLVACLEEKLQRKIHTIGCSLHQNELPFRAVFKFLDGGTKTPSTFSGPLGKLCAGNHHSLPQVAFAPMKGSLDNITFADEVVSDLSRDQRLLYEYVKVISSGAASERFATHKIGPLSHARWLTLATRLLCIYTRGICPTEHEERLSQVVKFIIEVYAPCWFKIKMGGKFHHPQQIIFDMIKGFERQSNEVQEVAKKNIRFNSFGLLPENFLFSMIKSEELEVREIAIKKILDIWKQEPPKKSMKKIPTINFLAEHWTDIIDLTQLGICEPALTEELTEEDLQEALRSGKKIDLPDLPCHSQSVERAVKLTSEASHKVYGQEARHRHILAKVTSMKMRPSFESKGQYMEEYDILD